ncbi:hypothetical protein [Amycolatopsis sp.]|uniref:hypothetical protein n=1 Tax=Amycolatopsis sp. TaxID=37632 RepID=UPI002D195C76|nr:hypothetical protein [Amycolatopsis sp.]HVV12476.1 hypothetical protein [Amycolatopsis sp.]
MNYYYQYPGYPPIPQPRNGLGTAGFVLGLVSIVFSVLPLYLWALAYPLGTIGLVLASVGVSYARRRVATNGGLATAGVVLSSISLVFALLMTVIVTAQ